MHQLPKLLQVDSFEQVFIVADLAPVGFVFHASYSNLFGYDLHCWHASKQGTLCTSLTIYSNLFGYDLHRWHAFKRGTLCTRLTMREEMLGMLRADLRVSTLALQWLHPRSQKNDKPPQQAYALLTSRSCPETTGNCLSIVSSKTMAKNLEQFKFF